MRVTVHDVGHGLCVSLIHNNAMSCFGIVVATTKTAYQNSSLNRGYGALTAFL